MECRRVCHHEIEEPILSAGDRRERVTYAKLPRPPCPRGKGQVRTIREDGKTALCRSAGERRARQWLNEVLATMDEGERADLRRRAQTMLQVSSLTARLIEQQAGEEGSLGGLGPEDLPEALR